MDLPPSNNENDIDYIDETDKDDASGSLSSLKSYSIDLKNTSSILVRVLE